MLGWLGGRAVGALWRRSERAALRVATPVAMRWGGVVVAWVYALLAGWGVPAQRTVLMLAATALLRSVALDWPAALVAIAAMVPVTLLDPWALLQSGFWLSFAAVGLLMVSEPARGVKRDWGRASPSALAAVPSRIGPDSDRAAGPKDSQGGSDRAGTDRRMAASITTSLAAAASRCATLAKRISAMLVADLRGGVRAQVVASIGLAPLTLVAFQQVSLVGLLANLVAEPWVTLVVTPLALLGVAVPGLWQLAALALRPLLWWLAWLNGWPLASVHVATAPTWGLVAGLVGGALLMLPIPWRVRMLGPTLLLPLVAPFVARPPPGRFELVAADVGQGTAVLVRTREHLLLFDTGPRFGEDNDAGRRMLLPLLQARGESRVDTLMLSHADADHVGGAQSIIDRLPVLALRSSLDARNPLRANAIPHTACAAGQAWSWDGVRFLVLHPLPSDYRPGAKTNSISCVLRVVDADGRSALLTGDIEAPQEAALVARMKASAGAGPGTGTGTGTGLPAPGRASPASDAWDGRVVQAGGELQPAIGDPASALRSDVLVVPHHGSRTSSTEAFLRAVRPRVAVIQVGYRSRYGHPAPEVVARYRALGIPLVRTDHCGAWTWRSDEAHCTRAVRRRYWGWQGPS
jgi:competence protein ComEC